MEALRIVCTCGRFYKEQDVEANVALMEASDEPLIIHMSEQYVCPSCGSTIMVLGEPLTRKGEKNFKEIYQSLRCKGKKNELYECYQ